jgi:hypothetical protein
VSDDAPPLAQPSAAEDWFERSKTFFEDRNYALASQCFERARQRTWWRLATAHDLLSQARAMRGGSTPAPQRRATAFQEASDAFAACSTAAGDQNAQLAAECWEESRRDTLAASSLSRPGRVKANATSARQSEKTARPMQESTPTEQIAPTSQSTSVGQSAPAGQSASAGVSASVSQSASTAQSLVTFASRLLSRGSCVTPAHRPQEMPIRPLVPALAIPTRSQAVPASKPKARPAPLDRTKPPHAQAHKAPYSIRTSASRRDLTLHFAQKL